MELAELIYWNPEGLHWTQPERGSDNYWRGGY
jgi:hypothetical protein